MHKNRFWLSLSSRFSEYRRDKSGQFSVFLSWLIGPGTRKVCRTCAFQKISPNLKSAKSLRLQAFFHVRNRQFIDFVFEMIQHFNLPNLDSARLIKTLEYKIMNPQQQQQVAAEPISALRFVIFGIFHFMRSMRVLGSLRLPVSSSPASGS